jgi:hypothetical protein
MGNFPPEWVAALREDALSESGRIARERAGLQRKLLMPRLVSIRVGTLTPDRAASGVEKWLHGGRARNVWLKHAPVCQACGERIEHGATAVEFRFSANGRSVGRERFVHEVCQERHTP